MNIKTPDTLEVKYINNDIGYGVFTNKEIQKGEIVEVCYYLEFNNVTGEIVDYLFKNTNTSTLLLPLGYGSIYNHSYTPNIRWEVLKPDIKIITFTALIDIKDGEELRFNYGEKYWIDKKKKITFN